MPKAESETTAERSASNPVLVESNIVLARKYAEEIVKLESVLVELERKKQPLLGVYSNDHPNVREVSQQQQLTRDSIEQFNAKLKQLQENGSSQAVNRQKNLPLMAWRGGGQRFATQSPNARPLIGRLEQQERQAGQLADQIRQRMKNLPTGQNESSEVTELRSKLRVALTEALDTKFQLEELQVQEMQQRLSLLERQIGQRKELRDKIVSRRTTELLSGEETEWNPDQQPTGHGERLEIPQANDSYPDENDFARRTPAAGGMIGSNRGHSINGDMQRIHVAVPTQTQLEWQGNIDGEFRRIDAARFELQIPVSKERRSTILYTPGR
ncbi:MAG: hypothetical protein FJ267_16455, partial [Planctomycetes bacterium]|nr:hypothetical protein [Planctomycetota bacterium]